MYGNFRNINRAARRGHLQVKEVNMIGEPRIYRRVKSNKVGAGTHTRWVKGFNPIFGTKWTAL